MKKNILCIGHAAYDVTFPMKKFPIENTKNRVTKKIECGGGPASNAAYLLGKWGKKPYFAGIVGYDIYGKKIKEEFINAKVNVDFLEMTKKYPTTVSTIIINETDETRTILTHRNKNMLMTKKELNIIPDIILVDAQEFDLSVNMINQYKDSVSIIDAGRFCKETIQLCQMVNYIVCSREFAEKLTNIKIDFRNSETMRVTFEMFEKLFPGKYYVITLEEKGSIFLDGDTVKYMPTYRMQVKDTTGAGDIFHGAFTYAISEGYSLENAVKLGNIAGALSTRKIGGRYSVPSKKETMDLYAK